MPIPGAEGQVDGAVYATCLRHRMDGSAQALPQEWLGALETEEVRCDLYPACERRAA